MISIKVNSDKVITHKIMYYLTGDKKGINQLKILAINFTYCLIWSIVILIGVE